MAETLLNAGHNVTVFKMFPFDTNYTETTFDERIRVLDVNASRGVDWHAIEERQSRLIYKDIWFWNSEYRELMNAMMSELVGMCERESS